MRIPAVGSPEQPLPNSISAHYPVCDPIGTDMSTQSLSLTSPEIEFAGKRALITGGTRGIGRGIADRLLAGGASVAVAARSTPEDIGELIVIEADVSTADGAASLGQQALQQLGGIDFVVHNVGGSTQSPGGSTTVTDHEWQHAFDSNLFTAVRLDRALVPTMLQQGSGAIVHITSIQRRTPLPASLPSDGRRNSRSRRHKPRYRQDQDHGLHRRNSDRPSRTTPGYRRARRVPFV